MLGTPLASAGTAQMTPWCPPGAIYSSVHLLCMTPQYAIGPFSQKMVDACLNVRGHDSVDCKQDNWDIFFAGILRGQGDCQPGTERNTDWNVCVDRSFGYGPFSHSQVETCKKLRWGYVCELMKWPFDVFQGYQAPAAPQVNIGSSVLSDGAIQSVSGLSQKLLRHYASASNYRNIHAEVMQWFGTTRNACVAFITTAMRAVGVNIPRRLNSKGYNISTWTGALSEYLEFELGWTRINAMAQLQPGDVAFTYDTDGSTRVPAHVFLFVEWANSSSSWAKVIDNQGFLHSRDLSKYNGGSFTPFHYALRPRE